MTPERIEKIEAFIQLTRQFAEKSGRHPWLPTTDAGDNWLVSSFGCHHDNTEWYVTTDHVHASEYDSGGAKDDAAFVAHMDPKTTFAFCGEVSALIARVEELEVENTRLEEHSKQIASDALEVKGLSVDEMQAQFDEWTEQKLKELTGDLEGRIKSIDTDMIPEFERVKDELSRLRAENEKLRVALEPFAKLGETVRQQIPEHEIKGLYFTPQFSPADESIRMFFADLVSARDAWRQG